MKWIRTVALLLVALGLGLWAYYGERNIDQRKAEKKAEKRLVHFNRNNVRAITLIAYGDTMYATRQFTNQWSIEKPIPWSGNGSSWESVIGNIAASSRERSWAVPPDSLHLYGLDPPQARVIFHLRDKTSDTLDVGSATPTGSRCYARYPRSDTVFTTSSGVRGVAVRPLRDMRDKVVMPIQQKVIQRITIKRGRNTLALVRDGKAWRMTEPARRAADKDTVNALLKDITSARAKAFHDNPKSIKQFGLDPPEAEVRLVASIGGQTLEKRLLIGKAVPVSGKKALPPDRYVMDPSRNSVMETSGTLHSSVTLRPADRYWNRHLTQFQRRDINRVALVFPDSTISMTLDTSATWRFDSPHEGGVKRWRVNTLVADADLARGKVFIDGKGSYGLDHPRLSVILYHDDEVKSRIDFGRSHGGMVYARGSASDQVFLVDNQLMSKFDVGVDELKELPRPQ